MAGKGDKNRVVDFKKYWNSSYWKKKDNKKIENTEESLITEREVQLAEDIEEYNKEKINSIGDLKGKNK